MRALSSRVEQVVRVRVPTSERLRGPGIDREPDRVDWQSTRSLGKLPHFYSGVEDDRRPSEDATQTVAPVPGSASNAMRYVPERRITYASGLGAAHVAAVQTRA
jgi:hypothetical protein